MRFFILVPLVIILAGCAHDDYSSVSGDPLAMNVALHNCRHEASLDYLGSVAHDVPGVIASGLVGGAIGGAIYGATTAHNPSKTNELDSAIEKCMADKGYLGKSEN